MALPSSGSISFSQVNVEILRSATAALSMNDATVRFVAGKSSGAISMSDLRGKSYYYFFTQTISANTANYNLKAAAIAAGWNQTAPLNATVTINSGVYVYSTSTGAYAFQTGSTFPSGSILSLVNYGTILGMGGSGGRGGNDNGTTLYDGVAGSIGGPALLIQSAISITNNGIISGGGGGGGGGGAGY